MGTVTGGSVIGAGPHTDPRFDDEGTALLLTIGYALLALCLVLVCADATSLYIGQKRADAAADAAALAGADGFVLDVLDGAPRARLTDAAVAAQAEAILDGMEAVTLESAGTPDGASARVTVSVQWRPPVLSLFAPDGIRLESTSTSRTALD